MFGNGEPLQIGGGRALTDGTLAGRVCVLAGGSGGIGAVLARALHAEGAPLVIGYRRARERAEASRWSSAPAGRRRSPSSAATWRARRPATRSGRRRARSAIPMVSSCSPAIRRVRHGGAPTQAEIEASLADNYVGPVLSGAELRDRLLRGTRRRRHRVAVDDAGSRALRGEPRLRRAEGGVDPRGALAGQGAGRTRRRARERRRARRDRGWNGRGEHPGGEVRSLRRRRCRFAGSVVPKTSYARSASCSSPTTT